VLSAQTLPDPMLSVADCETGIKAEMQLHATDITMHSLFPRAFYFYNVGHARACTCAHAGLMPCITRLPLPLNYIIQINFTARWVEAEDTSRAMISILTSLNFPLQKIPSRRFCYHKRVLCLLVEYNNHTAARAREIWAQIFITRPTCTQLW